MIDIKEEKSLKDLYLEKIIRDDIIEHRIIMKFYPITIQPTRYGGSYEGCKWCLVGGLQNPRQAALFGSDIDCMDVWKDIPPNGGIIHIKDKDIFVVSGESPENVWKKYKQFVLNMESDDTDD